MSNNTTTKKQSTAPPDNIVKLPVANVEKVTAAPPLSLENFKSMLLAVQRLEQLRQQAVVTKNSDSEIADLTLELTKGFLTHAGEFLGCWQIVQAEYLPLVNSFKGIFRRHLANVKFTPPATTEPPATDATKTTEPPATDATKTTEPPAE